ncbi:aminodeoxychorismate lyase [Paenibacillus sp. FJAT-26967]|uniref:aminodeoxychorismate lyase n=1 Tax=Paenibacillus sp. FJAT-26967 TaxID=1729690 RepID=UPI0008395C93|nr:aminodeoxychorismate lyase [Paenibacillus sp. FJAT-26967]
MKIWFNGQIIEEELAVVSVYDHGFLYGMGLFETFRTYNGQPFLLQEHLDRMQEGCRELGIPLRSSVKDIQLRVYDLLKVNQLQDAYIRYTISAGVDVLGLPSGSSYKEPTEILYIKELPARLADNVSTRPLQFLQVRRNSPEGTLRRKSFHYMNNILAKRELMTYPWAAGAEGLFLTDDGHVAEGIVSNLFWIKGGICFTPSLETGILPGITRAYVMRLAEECGLQIIEGCFDRETLSGADEIFMTNSVQEIVAVDRLLDEHGHETRIGTGTPGRLTGRLAELYQHHTQTSTGG